MASSNALLSDTDRVFYFGPSQEARHSILCQANELARTLVGLAVADSDAGRRFRVVVGVDHEDLTVKQRGFLHKAVLPQISEQVWVTEPSTGKRIRYVVATWKEYFRKMYLGERWETYEVPGKFDTKGRQVRARRKVRVSTEHLSIKQYSNYIDQVIDHATLEFGVQFVFIATEREEVIWKPARRKAAPQQEAATC